MAGKGYIERCLWDYRENVAMIERLYWLVSIARSVRGHSYEAHVAGNQSDAVGDVVHYILQLEKKIARTQAKVKPVERLQSDIAEGAYQERYIREVLKLRYLEHVSVDEVREALSISSSTYGRAKQKLLRIAGKYFGIELDIES